MLLSGIFQDRQILKQIPVKYIRADEATKITLERINLHTKKYQLPLVFLFQTMTFLKNLIFKNYKKLNNPFKSIPKT